MIVPLGLWALATVGFIVVCRILVPEFHWGWLLFFGFIYGPITSYIGARLIGLTGQPYGAGIPYIREAAIFLSGYQGVAIWFAPLPLQNYGMGVRSFKQLELTKTKFVSYIKLTVLTTFLIFICSFIFYEFIWRLGPIPSAVYPYVQEFWPYFATLQTMWLKSTLPAGATEGAVGLELLRGIVKPEYVATGIVTGSMIYVVLALLKAPTLIFYGLVSGLTMWPHFVILPVAGALLGRY